MGEERGRQWRWRVGERVGEERRRAGEMVEEREGGRGYCGREGGKGEREAGEILESKGGKSRERGRADCGREVERVGWERVGEGGR